MISVNTGSVNVKLHPQKKIARERKGGVNGGKLMHTNFYINKITIDDDFFYKSLEFFDSSIFNLRIVKQFCKISKAISNIIKSRVPLALLQHCLKKKILLIFYYL